MPLSNMAKDILSRCAEVMARQDAGRVEELYDLQDVFSSQRVEIVEHVKSEVARVSRGRLTVCLAEEDLFERFSKGIVCYLAVAEPSAVPSSGIMEDMDRRFTLYTLGAYSNGLKKCNRATAAEFAARKQAAEQAKRRLEQRAAEEARQTEEAQLRSKYVAEAQQKTTAFLERVFTAIRRKPVPSSQAELRKHLRMLMPTTPEDYSLEVAAQMCLAAGWDFNELLLEAIC